MPGWIITGVRGEGKSLAAVGKIKEYALKGRPIATNLDLYLDNLLPFDNDAIIYRLPDKPRLEDFELLPPAYDVDYKAEDKNGLLVLDELGTWLNSRSWNDKSRLPMLNWLFLSRKLHWDIILLAQDYEMIDAQVRNTLCDYWVQSSRLDRQKIPYLAPVLEFLGFNAFMPKIHRYFVFYGFNAQQKPTEVWNFTGKDFYDGYNTNQRFLDGLEFIDGELVDTRCVTTYLPASYLSGHYYINKLQTQLNDLKQKYGIEVKKVAAKKSAGDDPKLKAYLLIIGLAVFMGWRLFSGGFSLKPDTAIAATSSPVLPAPVSPLPPAPSIQPASSMAASLGVSSSTPVSSSVAVETSNFIDDLLKRSRPRLSLTIFSEKEGFQGSVDFYQDSRLVERFKVSELHALGVALVRTPYGVDLLYKGKSYLVSSWVLPEHLEDKKS